MKDYRKTSKTLLNLFYAVTLFFSCFNLSPAQDTRSYQHGINFIQRPDQQWLLIWSSSGNPPTGRDRKTGWTHDVYYALINPRQPVIRPITLISKPEAQEPASSAITDDGHIMITMEDGWNTKRNVAQRFGIYDSRMQPVKPYPQMVHDGGHSGHVAAVKNRFVVFFSDEWIQGGGVDNLGSGDDVLANIYTSKGELRHTLPVATGNKSRDWWPLVGGSEKSAMLVWQRFVDGQTWSLLMMAVIDPATGRFIKKPVQIANNLEYYTYSVAYLSKPDRFLVTGTHHNGGGFAQLFSANGEFIHETENIPPVMREARIIQHQDGNKTVVAQAVKPAGIMILAATTDKLVFQEKISLGPKWSIAGTDGIFIDDRHLFLVGLSEKGLMRQFFEINQAIKEQQDSHQDTEFGEKAFAFPPSRLTPSLPVKSITEVRE